MRKTRKLLTVSAVAVGLVASAAPANADVTIGIAVEVNPTGETRPNLVVVKVGTSSANEDITLDIQMAVAPIGGKTVPNLVVVKLGASGR